MTHLGNLDLIQTHRLAFSSNETERALDVLHARAFLEGRTLGINEAVAQVQVSLQAVADSLLCVQLQQQQEREQWQQRQQQEREQRQQEQRLQQQQQRQREIVLDRLAAGVDKLQRGMNSLNGYHKTQSDAYEVLVASVVRTRLRAGGDEVYELPRSQHKIPKFPPTYDRGVEWDGVLYMPALKHLYLIEAKGNLDNGHITGMQPRIQRTMQFMNLCADGQLPPSGASYNDEELCRAWAHLAAAEQVFGVVGAPGFTSGMITTASDMGLLAMFFNSGMYHLQLPQSDELLCHKTGRRMHVINGTTMTEEEVEREWADDEADA